MAVELALLLHAHLPYVRHPEVERSHEETWLFEALTETYLPLLRLFEGWTRDQLDWRLSLTVTPTLAAMLADSWLQDRYGSHLADRRSLAAKERGRTSNQPEIARLAAAYQRRWEETTRHWETLQGQVLPQLRLYGERGRLELVASAATHALLPLLRAQPWAARAQVALGTAEHRRHFGRAPVGFWLPECGWDPFLDSMLRDLDIAWTVVETEGILGAIPRPSHATWAPVRSPAGLAVFGRSAQAGRQVWSREEGYPGDSRYLEFHRDLGFDAEWEYIRPHLASGQRGFTGFKYHRVTRWDGALSDKGWYQPSEARQAVDEHAADFLAARRSEGALAVAETGRIPIVVAPFDAELFGHWWAEGIDFLDAVVRGAAASGSDVRLTTPRDFLRRQSALESAQPAPSTWGANGTCESWLDTSNLWIQPLLATVRERYRTILQSARSRPTSTMPQPILEQVAREILLAEASDWPFLMRAQTAGDYPVRRVRDHLAAAHQLLNATPERFSPGNANCAWADRMRRHPVFPDLGPWWRAISLA